MSTEGSHRSIDVLGGVSSKTRKPYVQFTWGDESGQLDIETARMHALLILEACQNAVTDAALLEWATKELEFELPKAVLLIDALRHFRADRWGQPDLEMEFQDEPPKEPREG